MQSSCNGKQWQQDPMPPPPPYDSRGDELETPGQWGARGAELVSPVFERVGQQTIPKIAEAQLSEDDKRRRPCDDEQRDQDGQSSQRYVQRVVVNGQPSCRSRRSSLDFRQAGTSDGHNDDSEFLNSLSAPRSAFFRCISIEPVAFLAIMALYLEFPAIQDLIYTKICLEVAGTHTELFHRVPTLPSNATSPAPLNNQTLPASGRIQQPFSTPTTSNQTLPTQLDLHVVCDRPSRTLMPAEIRQEIVDLNSLFWLKYQILICLLCALSGPYWGGVSDRIGRILPLSVPIFAAILCNVISLVFGLLISLDWHALVHLNWLYAGALLVGLSGGQSVLISNAFSFISDNTSSEERSKRVTMLESVVFMAHSLGFLLSKLIMPLGLTGPAELWLNRHFVSFTACIALHLASLIYSTCCLRHHKFHKFLNNFEREQCEVAHQLAASSSTLSLEASKRPDGLASSGEATVGGSCDRLRELTSSTPDDPEGPIAKSDKSNWRARDTLLTFRYYRETYETATRRREARVSILLLLLLGFLSALSLAALMSLFFVYVKSELFNWPTSQYSAWNANSSISRGVALVSLTVLMRFVASWRLPDAPVAALGFLGKGVGLLMVGLAPSTTLLNWSLLPLAVSEFSMPPIRSLLSKLVPREELCKLYSCLGALQSFCFILGNLVFYLAFTSYMQRDFFRLAFVSVGAIELAALPLVLLVHATVKRQILIT